MPQNIKTNTNVTQTPLQSVSYALTSSENNAPRISVSAAIPRLASTVKYGSSSFHGQLFRKVRRSSARILFRMSYFLRKEVRGRIKRKRRIVQKERRWLSRITWSLTTYYGTLFRKRRGPARWLKKQFAALRRVLSGKFHAYESRFESRLDYWLYKLHFTRRLSHSIILLKAGHIRLNGIVEKRFDHILRPLDVITFSPKVARWYRRCFHGTVRRPFERQFHHPRKKLNVAFYLNSRRFVQQRKTYNALARNRFRRIEFSSLRNLPMHNFAKSSIPAGRPLRLWSKHRQRITDNSEIAAFANSFTKNKVWHSRTPRIRRVLKTFRGLLRVIAQAQKKRNINLRSKHKKMLLPTYQLNQLKLALRPRHSKASDLDTEEKRPMDYFLVRELHKSRATRNRRWYKRRRSLNLEKWTSFASQFTTSNDFQKIYLLTQNFPRFFSRKKKVSARHLRRLQLLCLALINTTSLLQVSPKRRRLALKRCVRKLQKSLRLLLDRRGLIRRGYYNVRRAKRIRRRKIRYIKTWAALTQESSAVASKVTALYLRRKLRRRLLRNARRSYRPRGHVKLKERAQMSKRLLKKQARTLGSWDTLSKVSLAHLPMHRLVKRLASYKAMRSPLDTVIHQLTQRCLSQQSIRKPRGRSGLRTFIMTFTSRGKILKGKPRLTATDYSSRRAEHLLQRGVRPSITQAARTLALVSAKHSLIQAIPLKQDLYKTFNYTQNNATNMQLSQMLRTLFFRSRTQQYPCWKHASAVKQFSAQYLFPDTKVATATRAPKKTGFSLPRASMRLFRIKQRKKRGIRSMLYKKRWDLTRSLGLKPSESLALIPELATRMSAMNNSYLTINSAYHFNRRYAAQFWERNIPHYEAITNPLRYKTASYKRHKQRQQLTTSFRNRVARWWDRRVRRNKPTPLTMSPLSTIKATASWHEQPQLPYTCNPASRLSQTTANMSRFYTQDLEEWSFRRRWRLAAKTEYSPLMFNPEYHLVAYYYHLHGNNLKSRRLANLLLNVPSLADPNDANQAMALQTLYTGNGSNAAHASAGSTDEQLSSLSTFPTEPILKGPFDTDKSIADDLTIAQITANRATRGRSIRKTSLGLVRPRTRLRSIFQPSSSLKMRAVRWLPTPQARHRMRSTDQWPTPIPYYRWTWRATPVKPRKAFTYAAYFNRAAAGLPTKLTSRRAPTSALLTAPHFSPRPDYTLPSFTSCDLSYTSLLSSTICFTQFAKDLILQSTCAATTQQKAFLTLTEYTRILTQLSYFTQGSTPMLNLSKVTSTLVEAPLFKQDLAEQPLSAVISSYETPSLFHWNSIRKLQNQEINYGTLYNFSHLQMLKNIITQFALSGSVKQHRQHRRHNRRHMSHARRLGYIIRQQKRSAVVSYYYARKRFNFINRMHTLAPRAHVINEVHLPTYAHVVTWRRSEKTPAGVRRHGTALTKQRIYAFIRRFKHLM